MEAYHKTIFRTAIWLVMLFSLGKSNHFEYDSVTKKIDAVRWRIDYVNKLQSEYIEKSRVFRLMKIY